MKIDLNEFAREVHALAVEKGFYDPEPTEAELIAAIHSEISEAFEEWRAERPMVYHECALDLMCDGNECADGFDSNDECKYRNPEPHGIAVELIDVALRVLDFMAGHGFEVAENDVDTFARIGQISGIDALPMPDLTVRLHYGATLAISYMEADEDYRNDSSACLDAILASVFSWIRAHGIAPEALLLEKHRYNQTRPHRHGGKRV